MGRVVRAISCAYVEYVREKAEHASSVWVTMDGYTNRQHYEVVLVTFVGVRARGVHVLCAVC